MSRLASILAGCALLLPAAANAAQRVHLTNGFDVDCLRSEPVADNRLRLYLSPAGNYIDVATASVRSIEPAPDLPVSETSLQSEPNGAGAEKPSSQTQDIHQILASAGEAHRIDLDLLASVIHTESNGNPHAVSRAGARGLMQLMPSTANDLGVHDAFAPADNVRGGTTYLDQLLIRYHEDIALALAAYNAGPAAVDRYHGIPPYRETRLYVARVIREFNRRKLAAAHPTSRQSVAHTSIARSAPTPDKDIASR